MPPRRATRSASAAVPEEKASTSRRKRGRSEVDEGATEEIVEKPLSRAKKPPSTTSRTRTSVRSRPVLKDVPETEEEVQPVEDSPPPVKRRRGVAKEKPTAVSDDTIQHNPPRRKGQSTASSRISTGTSRARTSVVVKDEEDGEVEEVPAPTRRSTRTSVPPKPEPSSAAIPSEKPKKQPARSSRKPVVLSDNDSDIVEISATEAASLRSKTRASTSRKSNSQAGPSKPPVKQKSPSLAPLPESEQEPEPGPEPESTHDHPLGAQGEKLPSTTPKPSPKKAPPPPVVESEGEEPLMGEPPIEEPSRIPPTQPPPHAPEEPDGPQPRLVIHKIALINFKSYAGRQEIGPFHKV
jgi:structural maintenance of chromosome 4